MRSLASLGDFIIKANMIALLDKKLIDCGQVCNEQEEAVDCGGLIT